MTTFLILKGDGINCERETAQAFREAGGRASTIHVNDLLAQPKQLRDFEGLALPGGFSFGDELGSGQLMALKLKYGVGAEFERFVRSGKPILGICNGFQILAKLGLLPFFGEGEGEEKDRVMGLAENKRGHFIDRRVSLKISNSTVCKWTHLLTTPTPPSPLLAWPIRHKEGRVVFPPGREGQLYKRLQDGRQIVFTYEEGEDVNGSYGGIAGLCDPTGLILGIMPHPEAAIFKATSQSKSHPLAKDTGHLLFKGIIDYLKGRMPSP